MLLCYAQSVNADTVVYSAGKLHLHFQFEGHSCITKCAKLSNEECLDLVFYFERNLMIPRLAVEKT
jgi:hypothetical protein